ncbi:hypothetical protein ACHAXT_007598 [Thalassiosira profunda]
MPSLRPLTDAELVAREKRKAEAAAAATDPPAATNGRLDVTGAAVADGGGGIEQGPAKRARIENGASNHSSAKSNGLVAVGGAAVVGQGGELQCDSQQQPQQSPNTKAKVAVFLEGRMHPNKNKHQKKAAPKAAKEKDPHAPKRAMSSYMLFCEATRAQHTGEGKLSGPVLGQMWNGLDDGEKRRYDDMAAEDKLRYERELAAYVPPAGGDGEVGEEDAERSASGAPEKKARKRRSDAGTKRKKKDPNAPKGKRPAFNFYQTQMRPKFEADHPNTPFKELSSLIGASWGKLSDEERRPFLDLAAEDKVRYDAAMVAYEASKPSTDDAGAPEAEDGRGARTTKEGRKKDPNAPKRPPGPFILFQNEMRPQLKEAHPIGEVAKIMSERWKKLSDEEQQSYRDHYEENKKAYEVELAAYEARKPVVYEGENPEAESVAAAPAKKGRKRKDPNAPKGPKQACIYYQVDVRDKFTAPGKKSDEVYKLIAESWKKLSDEEKKPYKDLAAEDKKRYSEELAVYEANKPAEKAGALETAAATKKGGKKAGKKKRETEPQLPVPPVTIFQNEMRPIVKKERPGIHKQEMNSILNRRWKLLSKEEQQVYRDRYDESKARYEVEFAEYNARRLAGDAVAEETGKVAAAVPDASSDASPSPENFESVSFPFHRSDSQFDTVKVHMPETSEEDDDDAIATKNEVLDGSAMQAVGVAIRARKEGMKRAADDEENAKESARTATALSQGKENDANGSPQAKDKTKKPSAFAGLGKRIAKQGKAFVKKAFRGQHKHSPPTKKGSSPRTAAKDRTAKATIAKLEAMKESVKNDKASALAEERDDDSTASSSSCDDSILEAGLHSKPKEANACLVEKSLEVSSPTQGESQMEHFADTQRAANISRITETLNEHVYSTQLKLVPISKAECKASLERKGVDFTAEPQYLVAGGTEYDVPRKEISLETTGTAGAKSMLGRCKTTGIEWSAVSRKLIEVHVEADPKAIYCSPAAYLVMKKPPADHAAFLSGTELNYPLGARVPLKDGDILALYGPTGFAYKVELSRRVVE